MQRQNPLPGFEPPTYYDGHKRAPALFLCPAFGYPALWRLDGATFGWAGFLIVPVVRTLFSRLHEFEPRGGGLHQNYEANFMKKSAKKSIPLYDLQRLNAIQFTPEQYELYQSSNVPVYSPSGEYLCTVCGAHTKQAGEAEREREINQLALLESLIVTNKGELHLSDRALAGLAETLSRARGFIGQ